MALTSKLFSGDPKLEPCAVSDPVHITPGAVGDHVRKIKQALILLDGLSIDPGELASKRYGASTAAALRLFPYSKAIQHRSGTATQRPRLRVDLLHKSEQQSGSGCQPL